MKQTKALVISLAALFQACVLVDKCAFGKNIDDQDIATQFNALFALEAKDINDIYPSTFDLRLGLKYLKSFLKKEHSTESNTLRYVLSLIHLTDKFKKNTAMMLLVRTRLTQAQRQLNHFDIHHPTIALQLADIYSQTLSTFRYRVMVKGQESRLKDTQTANLIRALLLSGVRACVLWRQMGGTRLQLLTSRKALLLECEQLLKNATYQPTPSIEESPL